MGKFLVTEASGGKVAVINDGHLYTSHTVLAKKKTQSQFRFLGLVQTET